MKVKLPILIKDRMHSEFLEVPVSENWFAVGEDFFLDGPVTRRVAVLDFDPETGELLPGTKFLPPQGKKKVGRYDVPDKIETKEQLTDPNFIRVCALSAVLRTMELFEAPDVLGRRLTWGFEAPQLLLVPRAGRWENACYERESRSLQFYFFPVAEPTSRRGPEELVYTSLSNDIVTHETGHAILDGIAPDLYHALTPQALALHEAIADLVAVVMAFRSRTLTKAVLDRNEGSIRDSNAFSGIAKQFENALRPFTKEHYLRNLHNDRSICDVKLDEPHALSEVLSGSLYSIIFTMHEARKAKYAEGDPRKAFSLSGKALAVAADQFKRLIFRALDYLPPGEVSFADYGRAVIAADQAIYPRHPAERKRLVDEFVKRGIVPGPEAVKVRTDFDHPAVSGLDLETLVEYDWAAYEFANSNRELLRIPPGIPFRVRPRLVTTKAEPSRAGRGVARPGAVDDHRSECLFKVSWDHKEENGVRGLPGTRQISVGTTLVIDWNSRRVRALLTGDFDAPGRRESRDALLRRLVDEETLRVGERAQGPDGRGLRDAIHAEVMGGLFRVRGMARTLHVCQGGRS